MTLLELNELTGEYTDEQYELIAEAFKAKRISNKLNKYINKIDKAIEKAKIKGNLSLEEINKLKKIKEDAKKISEKFDKLEKEYENKSITKAAAKAKINKLKIENSRFFYKMKKTNNKELLKKAGISGAVIGLLVLIGAILNSKGIVDIPGMFNKTTVATTSSSYGPEKINDFIQKGIDQDTIRKINDITVKTLKQFQ